MYYEGCIISDSSRPDHVRSKSWRDISLTQRRQDVQDLPLDDELHARPETSQNFRRLRFGRKTFVRKSILSNLLRDRFGRNFFFGPVCELQPRVFVFLMLQLVLFLQQQLHQVVQVVHLQQRAAALGYKRPIFKFRFVLLLTLFCYQLICFISPHS